MKGKNDMKVYISGPITGINDYLEKFNKAEEYLTEQGYTVINPAKVNSNLPPDTSYNDIMKMCYVMLDMADSIYMLPGWEKSKGACIEYGYAKAKGYSIMEKDVPETSDVEYLKKCMVIAAETKMM